MRQTAVSTASVSEIHRYPLKPSGVEEPLWMTPEWRRTVLDHLCESSWLCRASEISVRDGTTDTPHRLSEEVYILRRSSGISVVRCGRSPRASSASRSFWRRKLILEVVDLWREVRAWWCGEAVDRLVVRVLLTGGAVVDLARYEEDEWRLVGIVD